MTWVIDTCVVIDLVERDGEFSAASAAALSSKLDDSFVIAPITCVELAPALDGDIERQNAFLRTTSGSRLTRRRTAGRVSPSCRLAMPAAPISCV